MESIGITTAIPQEIVYAAGYAPSDLNNLFIGSPHPRDLVRKAEAAGFPSNSCSWIKGLYAVARERKINKLIAVTNGDCSNTKALMEVLQSEGAMVIPFGYPSERSPRLLERELKHLADSLGAAWDEVISWKERLDGIRRKLACFDRLCLSREHSSRENHLLLVRSSDMDQCPGRFEQEVDQAIAEKEAAPFLPDYPRVGYIGVPPVIPGIYDFIDSLGARVVYNEVQRQFSLPEPTDNLVDQYLNFTYPYDIQGRLRDIKQQISERTIEGIIHYTQSFCHRQIEDIVVRKTLSLPVLTLEIDQPGKLDGQTKTRIEGFIESLAARTRIIRES
ncbi:MAG: 2-hydroxyacyl-CoA dehydratase family protein [bacterium]